MQTEIKCNILSSFFDISKTLLKITILFFPSFFLLMHIIEKPEWEIYDCYKNFYFLISHFHSLLFIHLFLFLILTGIPILLYQLQIAHLIEEAHKIIIPSSLEYKSSLSNNQFNVRSHNFLSPMIDNNLH